MHVQRKGYNNISGLFIIVCLAEFCDVVSYYVLLEPSVE